MRALSMIYLASACAAGLAAAPALADAGAAGCRTTTMPDDSKVVLCKDASGHWRPADQDAAPAATSPAASATPAAAGALPARTQVTYRGTWSATITTAPRVNFNSLNVGSMLNQAMNTRSKTMGGDLSIAATMASGTTLAAYVWGSQYTRAEFVGTVENGYCRMSNNHKGLVDVIEGRCDRNGFSGRLKGMTADGHSYTSDLQMPAVEVVDMDERDRQQAAAQAAEAARVAAEEAKIRNAPAAGPALTKKLDAYVQQDSRGWAMNHYDAGSMTNVKIVDGSVKSGSYVLRGEYHFNGGQSGWVMAHMSGSNLQCIQFWDAMIGCRDLRTPEDGQRMRDVALGAMGGGAGGGGASPATGSKNEDMWLQQHNQEQYQQEQAQMEAQQAAANAQSERMQQPNSLGW